MCIKNIHKKIKSILEKCVNPLNYLTKWNITKWKPNWKVYTFQFGIYSYILITKMYKYLPPKKPNDVTIR